MIQRNDPNISKRYGESGTRLKNDFSRLNRKILVQVVSIAFTALFLGWIIQYFLIDGILQNLFAEAFVAFCQNVLSLSLSDSLYLYQLLFRNNKLLWLAAGMFILLLLIFYWSLTRMTKYFNEISTGLDQLVEGTPGDIELSPEMDFMESKLNKAKSILEQRERAAKEAEQRKNDLLVYLAHDIKTPLTSIIGYLSLLDEAPDMPIDQRAKYTGITLEKAYRLETLIDEFFEIARFNLQDIVLNKGKINLPFMLQQMADEFYPMLAPQGKRITVEAAEGLTLWGDADKLARVFNNILKNAMAYSYPNTTITVTALQDNVHIIITFVNQGNPIPPAKLDTIFEKFYRLDSARSSRTGGAGLGLAIAREILTAHGGTITAQSNRECTTFTVTLPVLDAELRES